MKAQNIFDTVYTLAITSVYLLPKTFVPDTDIMIGGTGAERMVDWCACQDNLHRRADVSAVSDIFFHFHLLNSAYRFFSYNRQSFVWHGLKDKCPTYMTLLKKATFDKIM